MADSVILGSDCFFGYDVQGAKGTAETTIANWFPLTADEAVELDRNIRILEWADYRDFPAMHVSMGQFGQGTVQHALYPGLLTDWLDWVETRDADLQGKWGTMVFHIKHLTKLFYDAKVRTATIDLVKNDPVLCTLDVGALHAEDDDTDYSAQVSMPTVDPYKFVESTYKWPDGSTAFNQIEACQIVVDNSVEDIAEGFRGDGGPYPREMYNLHGIKATGSFTLDTKNDDEWDRFRLGQTGDLNVLLTNGANTVTLDMPRTLTTRDPIHVPGRVADRVRATVEFTALGSVAGDVAPIVIS